VLYFTLVNETNFFIGKSKGDYGKKNFKLDQPNDTDWEYRILRRQWTSTDIIYTQKLAFLLLVKDNVLSTAPTIIAASILHSLF
jgi:hypothetical protein